MHVVKGPGLAFECRTGSSRDDEAQDTENEKVDREDNEKRTKIGITGPLIAKKLSTMVGEEWNENQDNMMPQKPKGEVMMLL